MKNLISIHNKAKLLEKELISNLIQNPESVVKTNLDNDLFYYQTAYSILKDVVANNKNIVSEFQKNNIQVSFFDDVTYRNVTFIEDEIKKVANSRRVYSILENSLKEIDEENAEEKISDIQKQLLNSISKKREDENISNLITQFKDLQSFYIEKFKNGNGIIGISTGIQKLDDIIDGFRPEHFWVVGGYTNMGKTQATLNLVASLVRCGRRVVFYSLEMSKVDILSRLIGIMTEQSGLGVLKGYRHDTKKVEQAFEKIIESNLTIINGKSEIGDIEFSMYEENYKQKVDLFVVDFIQLVTVKGAKSEYEMTTTAVLELQQMSQRLKTTIIGVSQITNEGAKSSNDFVMSFKGSGAIAAAADLAIEIVNANDDKGIINQRTLAGLPIRTKWLIRKNRHGKVGYLEMYFQQDTGVFTNGEFEKDDTNYFNK